MKLQLSVLAFCCLNVSTVLALEVTEKKNAPLETNCAVAGDLTIYGATETQLQGGFKSDGIYVVSGLSKVFVNVLGDKAIVDPNFSQPTNFTPGAGTYLVAWQNGKTKLNLPVLQPKDRYSVIAQVVYKVRRVPLGDGVLVEAEMISTDYTGDKSMPGKPINHGKKSLKFNTDKAFEDLTCTNILPKWCGDGIIDKEYGESCDRGEMNGAEGGTCSSTCQSVLTKN